MKKILCFALLICSMLVFTACNSNFDYKQNLTSYTLDLEYFDDTKTLKGTENVVYKNPSNTTLSCVKFHLYPNAFRENAKATVVAKTNEAKAYPNGKSYGNIQIESVKSENKNAIFEICGEDENILQVNFEEDLYPNDKIAIDISFNVTLPNINHRFGYGENAINICNFYPIACVYENGDFMTKMYNSNGDPFYSEVADYFVTIKYPNDLKLASSGIQTNSLNDGDTTITQVQAKCVRDFGFVLSNKFEQQSATYDNRVNINYYYYGDTLPDETMTLIEEVLAFFEDKIGKYPYQQLSVVETNFVHGGMEYPNMVLISDCLADYDTYQMVVIHELLHQWWYSAVGNNQFDYGWIDEGLTEFCTIYFYDKHSSFNKTMGTLIKSATQNYLTFVKVYKSVQNTVDTSMNRPLDAFNTEPEYVYNTYVKGTLMFSTIYNLVGEKNFVKALKYYYNKNIYEVVNDQEIISCFCKGTGKNLQSLFDSWLSGKVVIVGT